MNRKELFILITLAAGLGILNIANHVRKNNMSRNLALVIEEGTRQVSINIAQASELEDIPGIGPSLAKRIVEYRTKNGEFKELEDLRRVKGIGKNLFLKILPYVKL